MNAQPTPQEYDAADAIAYWFGVRPEDVRERVARLIAAHRPASDASQTQHARMVVEKLADELIAAQRVNLTECRIALRAYLAGDDNASEYARAALEGVEVEA